METLELIKRARSGDKLAREQVIEENMGLVYSIVRRFQGRGYDNEELSQIGAIGLIKAVDKFDLRFEVRFSTYAVPLITGEIKRFLRDDGMVRVSRSVKENGWRVKRIATELAQKLEREPSMEELAAAVELPVEDIVLALEATAEVESLHKPICFQDGKEMSLEEKIPEKRDWQEDLMNRLVVEELLDELKEKERQLIQMRYYDGKPQREVAERLGISQVQVSRLEKKLLLEMREKITGKFTEKNPGKKVKKDVDNRKIMW
ncbi:MAG: SigB/SigF/SigG family RNA polymerase sigma factor [Clostridiales bacterium]|nr:SigB/SigF/SigG family RNA polymerase sigma factor [Clostridiales bacterium]MDD7348625.1 SigB/SigF/SigG family RNA polymerase sigma factor [Clostridiales bacterium]